MRRTHKQTFVAAALAGALTLTSAYAQRRGRRAAHAGIQQQDPGEDHDARHGGDPHRHAQVRRRRADRRDRAEGLRQPRLPPRRRGVPQLHSRRVAWKRCALGNVERGATKSNQAVIFDQLLDSNPLLLTGNTDTVYCSAFLDLETDGPTVVEIPPGCGPGHGQRRVLPLRRRHGRPRPRPGQGRQVPDRSRRLQGRAAKDEGRGDTSSRARRRT